MRLKLAFGLTLVASAVAAAAVTVYAAPAPLRAPTYMYVGNKRVGSIEFIPYAPLAPLRWNTNDCLSYSGAFEFENRDRSYINVQYFDGQVAGHARIKTPRIWLVFKRTLVGTVTQPHEKRTLIGTATQRSPTRWDVSRRNVLKWGHTQGPDGPEAAAMLLLICG